MVCAVWLSQNEQKSQYEVADEAKYVKLIYQWYLMGAEYE